MRSFALIIVALAIASQSHAQALGDPAAAAARVSPGVEIRVRTMDGRVFTGKLERLDANGLRMRRRSSSLTLTAPQVAAIDVNSRRRNIGATVGLIIGGGFSAWMVASAVSADLKGPCPCVPLRTLVVLPMGVGLTATSTFIGSLVLSPPVWRPIGLPRPAR